MSEAFRREGPEGLFLSVHETRLGRQLICRLGYSIRARNVDSPLISMSAFFRGPLSSCVRHAVARPRPTLGKQAAEKLSQHLPRLNYICLIAVCFAVQLRRSAFVIIRFHVLFQTSDKK